MNVGFDLLNALAPASAGAGKSANTGGAFDFNAALASLASFAAGASGASATTSLPDGTAAKAAAVLQKLQSLTGDLSALAGDVPTLAARLKSLGIHLDAGLVEDLRTSLKSKSADDIVAAFQWPASMLPVVQQLQKLDLSDAAGSAATLLQNLGSGLDLKTLLATAAAKANEGTAKSASSPATLAAAAEGALDSLHGDVPAIDAKIAPDGAAAVVDAVKKGVANAAEAARALQTSQAPGTTTDAVQNDAQPNAASAAKPAIAAALATGGAEAGPTNQRDAVRAADAREGHAGPVVAVAGTRASQDGAASHDGAQGRRPTDQKSAKVGDPASMPAASATVSAGDVARAFESHVADARGALLASSPTVSARDVAQALSASVSTLATSNAATGLDGTPSALIESLKMQIRNGGGTVDMTLTPDELGALRVSVAVDHGTVKATVLASTTAGHDVVQKDLPALRSALEAQGLRVDTIDVREDASVGDQRQRDGGGASDGRSHDGSHGRHGRGGHRAPARPAAGRDESAFADVFDVVA